MAVFILCHVFLIFSLFFCASNGSSINKSKKRAPPAGFKEAPARAMPLKLKHFEDDDKELILIRVPVEVSPMPL